MARWVAAGGLGGENTAAKLDENDIEQSSGYKLSNEWSGSKDKGGVAFKWVEPDTLSQHRAKAWLGFEPRCPWNHS